MAKCNFAKGSRKPMCCRLLGGAQCWWKPYASDDCPERKLHEAGKEFIVYTLPAVVTAAEFRAAMRDAKRALNAGVPVSMRWVQENKITTTFVETQWRLCREQAFEQATRLAEAEIPFAMRPKR